ncbi:hypothetical protein FIU86_08665 [Roseovarius sp. THAF9]|uniref:hypothetical protein n=1 Tax=Roseovarius sp. THAF9 TaxID=2587847 RepID=UPI001267EEA7|nr:hypothetical protein [Roseovarius sp. THAF9]QFT92913.1 hypothetical protein FIU86_08665 [Roseovarius sp. THAF9]
MKPVNALIAAIAAALIAGPAAAEKTVTAAELIANPDAYTLDIGDGVVGHVKRVQPPRGMDKSCNIDMTSLQELARKEFRKRDDETAISVPIHMALVMPGPDSPFMVPTCYGAGGGCTIWVWA